jgi:hypothetical protein
MSFSCVIVLIEASIMLQQQVKTAHNRVKPTFRRLERFVSLASCLEGKDRVEARPRRNQRLSDST